MSATPPEANVEYSRADRPSRGVSGAVAVIPAAVLVGGLAGALLLFVAEFTTLYEVRTSATAGAISSVGTGSHQAYALVPVAVLAALLSWGAWRQGSRLALLAIGVLGVVAMLIALLGDLPDARASGLVLAKSGHYLNADSTPELGLYLETLGAALLILTCGLGLMLSESVPRPRGEVSAS